MNIHSYTCDKCKEIVYGSREREADGYRTWWYPHTCPSKERYKFDYISMQWILQL